MRALTRIRGPRRTRKHRLSVPDVIKIRTAVRRWAYPRHTDPDRRTHHTGFGVEINSECPLLAIVGPEFVWLARARIGCRCYELCTSAARLLRRFPKIRE